MIGRTLDRYRIDGKLGEGGMGVVYSATDPQLGRAVAIKVLPPEATADASRKQRFAQEARAASALNHPGIVTVYDVASDGGTDFIVMELVTGRTLDQILAGRGLGVVRALRYSVAIADALAKAHGAGIVHRDLKPSNVMVTEDDRIKILDFGLAKLFDEPDERAATQIMLTDRGSIVGTAAYMSPEQARGEKLDGRSDIFSFGSVLYEMLTGRRPFEADSKVGVLAKILNDDPPAPSSLVPVPTDVERAVLRCLRKDPARRFQTTADLKVALEDLIEDSAQLPRASMPVVPTPRWRRWAWLGLVPVLIAAAYLGWRAGPRLEDAPPLRAVPLLSLPGFTRSPSFSPDGSQIAFSWSGSDNSNPDIYVQQIGAGTPLRLTSTPANDYSPTWSPDGRWIAFLRGAGEGTPHELRLVPPLTGPERKLTDIRPRGFLRPVTLAWCPDSSCVVVTDSSGNAKPDALFVVSLDSGQKRQLTQPENPVLADTDPAISPDGRWLVFRRDNAPYTGELKLLPLPADMTGDGELRTLTTVAIFAYGPSWLPDSTAIVFSGKGGLWRRSVTRDEAPQPLPFVGEDGVTPTVSSQLRGGTRRLAYVRSYIDINLWRVDLPLSGRPAISPPLVAISSTRHDTTPAFSPDGRSLAITSTRSGENEVWRLDPLGANAVQLTSMGFNPGFPRWSPSGDTIAFQSNPEGKRRHHRGPGGRWQASQSDVAPGE